MRNLLAHVLTVAISLMVCSYLLPGVHVRSLTTLVIAACVLGLVNGLVRPVLAFFALPLTILTLGLFYLVVNGAAFALSAFLVPGFSVSSFTQAVLGALIVSVVSTVLGWLFGVDEEREKKRKKKD